MVCTYADHYLDSGERSIRLTPFVNAQRPSRMLHCSDSNRPALVAGRARRFLVCGQASKQPLVTAPPRSSAPAPAVALRASRFDGLSVSKEVTAVLPANIDLDCQLCDDKSHLGVLDIDKLLAASNELSELWSECEALVTAMFASLPLAARRPGSSAFATNRIAVQAHTFCEQLAVRYNPLVPGGQPLEFYIMSCLCLKVRPRCVHFWLSALRAS